MSQSDEDGGKQCFMGTVGLKVSDRKIKDFTFPEFMLLVCLSHESHGRNLPLSVRGSYSFSTRDWGVNTNVFLYIWYSACGFSSGTAVWFFDRNYVGLSQIDRRGGENEDENRRRGNSTKMKPVSREKYFVTQWFSIGLKQYSADKEATLVSLSTCQSGIRSSILIPSIS